MLDQISTALQAGLKANRDDDYCVMAQLVLDDPPQNPKELHSLLCSHLADGDNFNGGMKKKCTSVMAALNKKKLIGKAKPKAKVVVKAAPVSPKHESDLDTKSGSTPGWAKEGEGSEEEQKEVDPAWMNTSSKHEQDDAFLARK
jgi:hypothetical protein